MVFGRGAVAHLGEEMNALGAKRALVLSTPAQAKQARGLAAVTGANVCGVFPEAAMHTPLGVTEKAMEQLGRTDADVVVSFGGGSTIGLGKAIVLRADLPHIAIPTTYAGSEATPILGETKGSEKTTIRDLRVLPSSIIYDPNLSDNLPPPMSVVSGLNAMAHAAEALYARDRDPISTMMALEGSRAFIEALPSIAGEETDTFVRAAARERALLGAWLCGTVLGRVGMALHHKLCHVLGGTFGLSHAETHAIVLPHAISFNETAARDLLAPLAMALGADTAGKGLYDLAVGIGAPVSLAEIGFHADQIAEAVDATMRNQYWNPRDLTEDGLTALLSAAVDGRRPD
ncbi:maleylacetate reductase [uncultured Roseobacter sp.]|uniref:maleylacetate reductase n=1 Tax=uncultured Roseobacter sp. TaxID=114847 RepID=UPI00345D8E9F